MITCQACGTENPVDATFCSKCARKLDPETQQSVVRVRSEHTATGVRWSMVILTAASILIIIVLVALFVLHV
jgi:uncharacterized membrane protein YvbJ